MLKTLEIFSTRTALHSGLDLLPVLPITDAIENDLLQITKIDGLGPVAAVINTAKIGELDGDAYLGSTISKRSIVLTVKLNPNWSDWTIEALRNLLYAHMMPKSRVRLKFTGTHIPDVDIIGYVESIEPDIFSLDHEYQISIECPEPAFRAIDESSFYTYNADISHPLIYDGTVDCGIVLDITATGSGPYPADTTAILFHDHPNSELFVFKHLTMTHDETIEVSTVPGNKYAKIIPFGGGLSSNALQKITTASIWPILTSGENLFRLENWPGEWQMNITYRRLYGGL